VATCSQIHVSTESELYDKGLMLRTQLCSMIAAKYNATSPTKFISVTHCHPSPWLVVKQSDITARRDKKRRITGWLECVISCLIAAHGYLARLHGVDIELLRRSSFGFLEPKRNSAYFFDSYYSLMHFFTRNSRTQSFASSLDSSRCQTDFSPIRSSHA